MCIRDSNYPFASESYTKAFGIPKALSEAKFHRIIEQISPLLEQGAYERLLGVESVEGIVGVRTNTSSAVLYAVERLSLIHISRRKRSSLQKWIAPR